ncbi:MAG: hydroxyacid dehydrogenase [Deltaproteobacteria bacterium]|nr:hydroxyacid dehydrogenase [Deltaproteobacteria bacterium]
MNTVLYYEILSFQPQNLLTLKQHFEVLTLPDPSFDTREILAQAEVVFAPLGYYFGPEKIGQCPKLKVIASNTTGVPHIDVNYAARQGIKVISLQDQTEFLNNITPTAELTLGLLIAVTRRIPWAFASVCGGTWNRRLFGGRTMLSRLSLGVVGLGRLGKMVARYGSALGMKVSYSDLIPKTEARADWIYYPAIEDLVAESDVVTLHLPLNQGTQGLIGRQIFTKFKEGSCLINTSRGEIVESQALLEGLQIGRPAFAALDVLDGEFDPAFQARVKEHPLVKYASNHDNLLLTPHIGGSTTDAWAETEAFTIQLALEYLEGLE